MVSPEKLANKRQRKPKGQSKKDNPEKLTNKHQRIPKGQSKKDNPEKLETQGTQGEEKQNKNTICVGHNYALTNTNNVNNWR